MWQNLYKTKSFLFSNCNATDPNGEVLRLYDNKTSFDYIIKSHTKHGFLKETLSSEEISERFSVYVNVCREGLVAGGIIAEGFSFNILQFCQNVISCLEKQDVLFLWDTEIKSIEIENNIIQVLRTSIRELITSHHYSINTGVYNDPKLF